MMLSFLTTLVFLASPMPTLAAQAYGIKDTFIGKDFLSEFTHEAIPDPTNGRVNYLSQAEALNRNLTFASSDTLILRADSTTTLSSSGPGRASVRIMSKKQWTNSITVLDLAHFPIGCGTWPAFWTTRIPDWPTAGVNDVGPNHATLHTTDGCTMSSSQMIQTGALQQQNCYWGVNYNAGCAVKDPKTTSYGTALNDAGGGWYAMERTSTTIKVWFWAKNEPSSAIPEDIRLGSATVFPGNWGKPMASFGNKSCDISKRFGPNNIIINLTFCGDWAANAYPSSCPKTCVEHVNTNPAAFKNAYWDIRGVRVYEPKSRGSCDKVTQQIMADIYVESS